MEASQKELMKEQQLITECCMCAYVCVCVCVCVCVQGVCVVICQMFQFTEMRKGVWHPTNL